MSTSKSASTPTSTPTPTLQVGEQVKLWSDGRRTDDSKLGTATIKEVLEGKRHCYVLTNITPIDNDAKDFIDMCWREIDGRIIATEAEVSRD
jgi:hypothetical protein